MRKASDAWIPQGSNGLKYIDLFAGSGGLSLGLHATGWDGLFAVEKDPMAFETLRANLMDKSSPFAGYEHWPEWLPRTPLDIVSLLQDPAFRANAMSISGEVDLVAGGPPCQGFSVGGARRGENDPRNDLPFHFVDFVSLTRPRMVLLENVEGFDKPFSHQGHRTSYADVVAEEFRRMGYQIVKRTIHAVKFGVPQTRKRVVLFGVDRSLAVELSEDHIGVLFDHFLVTASNEFLGEYLPTTPTPVSSEDAIEDLHGGEPVDSMVDAPRFSSVRYRSAQSEYALLMRAFEDSEVPDSHRFPRHSDHILDLIRTAQETQKPGRLPQEFLRGMGTKSRKKFLLDRRLPASTLTSHPDEFFHYSEHRIITLREAARFQSFPDRFEFKGRYTLNGDRRGLDVSRCIQIANAIPPLMARGLGSAVEAVYRRIQAKDANEEFVLALQQTLPEPTDAPVLF